jgi:nucleoside-diphosphate-sugar epimerase
MKVLVTGATGFLGSHLTRRLAGEGVEVLAQGRDRSVGGRLAELPGCRFYAGDLGDKDFAAALPRSGVEAVVHCAALSSPWGRYRDFYRANVAATRYLAEGFAGSKINRFVHISSPSLYVSTRDRLDIREDEELPDEALNHYIRTKRLAEGVIDSAVRDRGLPAITLRPQGIVGAGDRSIFPRILRTARRGMVPRIGPGVTRTDLTYVENVVDACLAALKAEPRFIGRKYNITNGEPADLYAVIDRLLRDLKIPYRWKSFSFKKAYRLATALEWTSRYVLMGREPLLTRYSVCVLGVSRTLNIEAARRDLGYRPRVSLDEAMRRVVEAMA